MSRYKPKGENGLLGVLPVGTVWVGKNKDGGRTIEFVSPMTERDKASRRAVARAPSRKTRDGNVATTLTISKECAASLRVALLETESW